MDTTYLRLWIRHRLSTLTAGRNYEEWEQGTHGLQRAAIRNKDLAQELEKECKNRGGVLTYSEYLQIDQFGKQGYHATHTEHGMTNSPNDWREALTLFCKEKGYKNIIEFGAGDGKLGLAIVKEAKSLHHKVIWNGIEINEFARKEIEKRFQENNLLEHVGTLTSSLESIKKFSSTLVIFSYSLDSIPPEIFVARSRSIRYPDTIIGVTVLDGILQEVYMTPEQLAQKHMALQKGIFTFQGKRFDLTSWKLLQGQRVYLTLKAFLTLAELSEKSEKDNCIIIMDEFKRTFNSSDGNHLCIPLLLNKLNRHEFNVKLIYENAGENLFYYPMYFSSYESVLKSCGYEIVKTDIEKKMAAEMLHQTWKGHPSIAYFCFAVLATLSNPKTRKTILVDSPVDDESKTATA